MVAIAQQQGDFIVEHNAFLNFTRNYKFDGIWACASLLHVQAKELPAMFKLQPRLITSTHKDPLLPKLLEAIRKTNYIEIAVSFEAYFSELLELRLA